MLYRKLIYLLLLGVVYLFSVLYLPVLSQYLLLALLLVPLCLWVLFHLSCRRVKLHLELPEKTLHCGETAALQLTLENPGWMPLRKAELSFGLTHATLCRKHEESAVTTVPGRSSAVLTFPVTLPHAGHIRCTIKAAAGYDILGLFRHTWRVHPEVSCTVFPAVSDGAEAVLLSAEDEAQQFRPGDSTGSYLGVREYGSGDRLRDIHWKLSSRFPEPVVREYGEPMAEAVTASLLYHMTDLTDAVAPERLDAMTAAVLALGAAAFAAEAPLTLQVCSGDSRETCTVSTMAELQTQLSRILESPPMAAAPAQELPAETMTYCVADQLIQPLPGTFVFYTSSIPPGQSGALVTADTAAETVSRCLSSWEGDERRDRG